MIRWARRLAGAAAAAIVSVTSLAAAQTPPATAAPAPAAPSAVVQESAPAILAPAASSLPLPEDASDLEPYVDGFVRGAMRTHHIAGVGVAIVHKGVPVLNKGYGVADVRGRPVRADRTLFRLASISKTFTWIGLMQLAEAGRISLDAPANTYLPPALRIPDDGFSEPVRVRHLMTHTAGFEDKFAGQLFVEDPAAALSMVDALARHRPHRVRPPGVAAVYSNYGVALAGAIIQHVSGLAFEDYVEQRILTPLALQNTTFREPYAPGLVQGRGLPSPMTPALAADVADGFRWTSGAFIRQPFEHVVQFAPAGGASATTADMSRYMLALMGGGKGVLRPSTVAMFAQEKPLFANAPGVNGLAWGMMQSRTPRGWRAWGHEGDTLWFHSKLAIYPDLGLGVFVATNSEEGAKLRDVLADAIADHVGGPPPAPAATPPPTATTDAALRRFAGDYLADRRAFTSAERILCLAGCTISVSTAPDRRLVLQNGAESLRLAPFSSIQTAPGRRYHLFRDVESGETAAFLERDGRIVQYFGPSGVSRATRISAFAGPDGFFAMTAIGLLAAAAAFASGLARVFGAPQKSARARLAGLALPVAGLIWLIAGIALGAYLLAAAGDNWTVFRTWPGGVRDAVWLALAAAVATAGAAIAVALAWRTAQWSVWRRARILTTLAGLIVLGAAFHTWNLLSLQF